jgi:hypothetical protein
MIPANGFKRREGNFAMQYSRIVVVPALSALLALSVTGAEAGHRHRHHHHGNGAAVGAALGAGIFLGALAATAAAEPRDEAYVYDAPPPPPPSYGYRDRATDASEAIAACRQGMLDAARKYGAYDAEIGDVYSVRETEFGQIVRADIRVDYRSGSRTSPVTCEVEDGILVSARSDY